MMNNSKIKEVIFTANQAWKLLCLDELHSYDNYQISWLQDADRPYYNCIHIHDALAYSELQTAEAYFTERSSLPRVYTHTGTDSEYIKFLKSEGYIELPEEEELWYEFPIENMHTPVELGDFYKKSLSEIDIRKIDTEKDELEYFMKLNQDRNNIPSSLAEKFTEKIRKNSRDKNNSLECFAAFSGDCVISVGTMSCINGLAVLSEGATDTRFSRLGLYSTLLAFRVNLAYQRKCRVAYVRCDKEAWSNQGCMKVGFSRFLSRQLWEKRK